MRRVSFCLLAVFGFACPLQAETEPTRVQWPQHRADAARSGFVDDVFNTAIALHWVYRPRQAPMPAWRGEDTRMYFDQPYYPLVVSRGLLCYASSAECCVVALDAASGEERWSYVADAPVRFAPAFWEGRLFAVSDDGDLHVLEAQTGRLIDRIHLAPRRDMLLGNGRMISRWPARGGPVIRDGIVYFGAGIWPSEGIYLCAMDAATCRILWRNDDSGAMEWDQPHGGARAESGISAQGYLTATGEHLLVPTGRAVPAVFGRQDGALKYFHLQRYGKPAGGSTIVAARDFFFNGGNAFAETTGMAAFPVAGRDLMVATPRMAICSDGHHLQAFDWTEKPAVDGQGRKTTVGEPIPMSLGTSRVPESVSGAVGGAIRFDGAGDHVILDAPWADQPNTFAAWLKVSPQVPDGRRVGVIAGNHPDVDCINWEVTTRGRPRIYWKRGQVDWTVDTDVRTGHWTHVAFVRDAGCGQMSFYLDGELVATHDRVGDAISPQTPSYLGGDKRGVSTPWFDGAVDDVRVYNRPLEAKEVAALARTRQPQGGPLDGLIFHLPLDDRPATAGARLRSGLPGGSHGKLVSLSLSGTPAPHDVTGMIAVGEALVLGGPEVISALDLQGQSAINACWQAEVDGTAGGLAWAAGRLYVSTDRGSIYCFGPGEEPMPRTIAPDTITEPWNDNSQYAAAAEEILRLSKVFDGYALDLGSGEGRLAYELARRSKLHILAVESDPQKVARARQQLTAAGLYGTRITVHQADLAATAYPNYFADLVVSARSLSEGPQVAPPEEMMRVLRPWGGKAVIGRLATMREIERGALPGTGDWTHQYGNAANTLTSTDKLVQRPLGMLWFTDFAHLRMPDRHGRGPAPLFADGRLFVLGVHGVYAINAYNGRLLWEYPVANILKPFDQEHILGTAVTGSPYCYGRESIYARHENYALRIDAATGKLRARFTTPAARGEPGRTWGYLATNEDVLLGSTANDDHVTMWAWREGDMRDMPGESDSLFALDAVSGEHLWTYEAADSIRHNAVAAGAGMVYLIDRPLAQDDLLNRQKRRGPKSPDLVLAGEPAGHPHGALLALDARTGQLRWKANHEIFGTMLALSVPHDVLVMTYQHNHAYRLRSEIGGRMAAYQASTGKRLWEVSAAHQSRIMINGSTIYSQAGAWNLLTGEKLPFRLTRSYGCGTLAGSEKMLLFRSGTLGYRDLSTDRTENYGGIRPGCWINAIPAGGLVLMPDATHGCTCSYLNKAYVALVPMQ